MNALRAMAGLAALLWAIAALAVIETYDFSDPALEARYQALSAELRCPKCQNQNIADSNAPIAQDLRSMLHQQLERGASDEEIRAYMVARYGEFVRYRPRFGGINLALWLAPPVLLLAGACAVWLTVRRRVRSATANVTTTDAERAAARALLEAGEPPT